MAYDLSPAELQAYLDQARTPAERLAALQAMGAPVAAPTPAPAPVASGGSGGTGGASAVPAVGPANPADAGYAASYAAMSGRPLASLGGAPAPSPAPAGTTVIPEVTVTPGAPRALGGAQAPARPPPVNLRAAMAEAVGAPPPGQPELRNPVGDFVKPFTQDELAAQRELEQEQFQNVNDLAEAQQYAAEATRRASMAALDKQDAIDAEHTRRQLERQRTLQEGEQRYREMADQIAAEPIDSERLWNSKSTGEKVMNSIAVFLGAIGQGIAGLPNMAWEKIQRDIDRDIDAQKANKALLRDRLAAEGSLIDMTRARFADAATQDAVMRESAYRRVAAELDRFKDFAKTPERAAQLEALRIQANTAIANAEQGRRQALDAAVLQQRQIDAARAAAGAPMTEMQKLKLLAQKRTLQAGIAKAEREIAGEPDKNETDPVPMWNARVPKGMGKSAIEFTQATAEARNAIRDYRKTGSMGAGSGGARDRIVIAIKKMAGSGFSSDADMARLESGIPSTPVNFDTRIKQLEESLTAAETSAKQSLGVLPPSFNPKTEKK